MNFPGLPELLALLFKAGPGAFGSALSVFWGQRAQPLLHKFVLFASGTIFSLLATPELAKLPGFHLQEGFLLGFMVGLCSMALCGKIHSTVANLNLSGIVRDVIRKTLGLPPANTRPGALTTGPAALERD